MSKEFREALNIERGEEAVNLEIRKSNVKKQVIHNARRGIPVEITDEIIALDLKEWTLQTLREHEFAYRMREKFADEIDED